MVAKKPKFVAYIRLSKKDETGAYLGMDSQLKDCLDFVQARNGEMISEPYKEVETGKNDKRPELEKALKHCRKTGATLLVAKLDRLSRNVRLLMELRDSNVPLVAANIPDSNTLTFTVMAGLAQHERETISQRTKDALAIASARRKAVWEEAQAKGYPPPLRLLGGLRENSPVIRNYYKQGVEANINKAKQNADLMREDIEPLYLEGWSLRRIAAKLNMDRKETARGKAWSAQGVANIIERLRNERKMESAQ